MVMMMKQVMMMMMKMYDLYGYYYYYYYNHWKGYRFLSLEVFKEHTTHNDYFKSLACSSVFIVLSLLYSTYTSIKEQINKQ